MDIYVMISFALSVVVLIVFFTMSSNIGAIKKMLLDNRKENAKIDYYRYMSDGELDKARESLEIIIFHKLINERESNTTSQGNYDTLKEKYKEHYIRFNKPFPEYPFNKF